MQLLHIDSSITGEASLSREVSAAVVQAIRDIHPGLQVAHRDLDADPLPHLDGKLLAAGGDPDVLDAFLAADVVVIGAPMYNFSVPSQLKAWIDRIMVAGKTFKYSETGPVGLAGGKTVIVASTRGGLYGAGTPQEPLEHQETYLRAVFGFMGIDDVQFVRAEGVAYSPEHRAAALSAALAAAPEAAAGLVLAEAA